MLSIEEVVRLTLVSRPRIAIYCRRGLLALVAVRERDDPLFDREAIRMLFLLESLRVDSKMKLAEIRSTQFLLTEIETLRADLRRAQRWLQTLAVSRPQGANGAITGSQALFGGSQVDSPQGPAIDPFSIPHSPSIPHLHASS
jgi:DNA-binding transcriptional MerR regulator